MIGIVRFAALATAALCLTACASALLPSGPGPPVIAPRQARALGPAPVQGENVKFGVTTVTGIPGMFQIALDDALRRFAATRNLSIVPYGDAGATYRLQGYISAVGDVNRVILVYVWDVFDASGNRVHRFSGQEPTGSGGIDPWTAVDVRAIDNAARETVDALADWARA
jgi:hypothetical protein